MHASRDPGDFGLNLKLPPMTLVKIGLIDGGCPGTVDEKDRSFFESLSVDQFHSKKCVHKPDLMLGPHGISCASVICGSRRLVNFLGVCENHIQGVIPGATLHAYAIGYGTTDSCYLPDECITDAINKAIRDGVKVLSISIGPSAEFVRGHYKDPTDDSDGLMLLKATREKMLVCVAMGNSGPSEESVVAGMPWVMSVGACTDGRILETIVEIAIARDEKFSVIEKFKGVSLNVIESPYLKLCVHKHAWNKDGVLVAAMKDNACYLYSTATSYRSSVGSTRINGVPLATISKEQMKCLHMLYKEWRGQLFVKIYKSEYQEDARNVLVTNFSSRGPSTTYKDYITPDVVALGYAVLMSHPSNIPFGVYGRLPRELKKDEFEWIENSNIPVDIDNDEFEETESDSENDHEFEETGRKNEFEGMGKMYSDCIISSGTSFACPLVAAYASIVYSYHPEWGPLAVKSALITTATSFAARCIPGNEFAFGAGSIDLESALNPGLVYDESWENFQEYVQKDRTIFDLNLPTFAASFSYCHRHVPYEDIFTRKLTNVSKRDVEYEFRVKYFKNTLDPDVDITAEPSTLKFGPEETKKFDLHVKIHPRLHREAQISGMIMWLPCESTVDPPVCSPLHLYNKTGLHRRPSWYTTHWQNT